ncbi:MAG: divergent polysaccharide deacetylase family protein [Candidatus Cloacimonadaceae bacterium]
MTNYKLFIKLLLTISLLALLLLSAASCSQEKAPKPRERTIQEQPQDEYQEGEETPASFQQTTSLSYTYRFLDSQDLPPVAIIIDDFGYIGGDLLQGFAELDDNITFAVLPDLPNTEKSAQLANVYGHEVILHVPMEEQSKSQNPGARYIKTGMDESEIKAILMDFISQVPQAVGANNHMGSGVTADYETIYTVLDYLDSQGMFFLDSKTTSKSKVINAAKELKADYATRDIFLDVPDVSNATLNNKLKEIEKFRGRVEPIIIISHCHNTAKLIAMQTFVSHLQGMGVRLIPLSDAVKKFKLPS